MTASGDFGITSYPFRLCCAIGLYEMTVLDIYEDQQDQSEKDGTNASQSRSRGYDNFEQHLHEQYT
jgi:hypothetical protein